MKIPGNRIKHYDNLENRIDTDRQELKKNISEGFKSYKGTENFSRPLELCENVYCVETDFEDSNIDVYFYEQGNVRKEQIFSTDMAPEIIETKTASIPYRKDRIMILEKPRHIEHMSLSYITEESSSDIYLNEQEKMVPERCYVRYFASKAHK